MWYPSNWNHTFSLNHELIRVILAAELRLRRPQSPQTPIIRCYIKKIRSRDNPHKLLRAYTATVLRCQARQIQERDSSWLLSKDPVRVPLTNFKRENLEIWRHNTFSIDCVIVILMIPTNQRARCTLTQQYRPKLSSLLEREFRIALQWIPSKVGMEENESGWIS